MNKENLERASDGILETKHGCQAKRTFLLATMHPFLCLVVLVVIFRAHLVAYRSPATVFETG